MASSYDRFGVFLDHASTLSRTEQRALLRKHWSTCDGAFWRKRRVAVELLLDVGYIGDLARPTESLRLYRGVYESAHARGLCWSAQIETARYFAGRPGGRGPCLGGIVYVAMVPPAAILAGFNDRHEAEYVINPDLIPRRGIRRLEVVPPEPMLTGEE